MTKPILSNLYVLQDIEPDKFETMLRSLKKKLAGVKLNLNTVDWRELRTELRSLASQAQELSRMMTAPEGVDLQGEETTRALLPVSTNQSLPVVYSADLASWTAHVEDVVQEKQAEDSRLPKVFADLRKACFPKEEPARGLIEYYVQFFPAHDVIAAKPAGVIRRMFEGIIEALRMLLKAFTAGAPVVWDVLKDPDGAYLRFRGEMHELEVRHPNYAWLEYVLLLPDLFRLYVRLMFDPDVAWPAKAKVLGALAYLVLPYDFLPEAFLGPLGYADDVFLMALAVLDMTSANQIAPGKLEEHWAGDPQMLLRIMEESQRMKEKLNFFGRIYKWFQVAQGDKSFVT